MKNPAHAIPLVMIRLDGSDYLTVINSNEYKTVRRLSALRRSIRELGVNALTMMVVLLSAGSFLLGLSLASLLGLNLSFSWLLAISAAMGPVLMLAFMAITSMAGKSVLRSEASRILYRIPSTPDAGPSGLKGRHQIVVSIAGAVDRKLAANPQHVAAVREQTDAVVHQLACFTGLLADGRGLAGHNQLAEDAHLLGDALPAGSEHLAAEHVEWLAGQQQWEDDYWAARKSLKSAEDAFHFAIRVARTDAANRRQVADV